MRRAFAIVLLSGCSFDRAGVTTNDQIDAAILPTIDSAPGTPDAPIVTTPDAAVTTAKPCPKDDALVACYRFETGDVSKEPHDDSKYKNDGLASAVTFTAGPTSHGLAMSFGPTSTTSIPDSASLDVSQITIELWLYVNNLPPQGGRAGLVDNNNQYGLFLAPDGGVRCVIGSATDIGLAIPTKTWTHVACTYDGSAITLYQNGLPGAVVITNLGIPTTSIDGMGLGQNVGGGTPDHLDGALDDVWIWNRPRAQTDLCVDAMPLCL
ncbi:MAG TPA: LamG domain-containing protein [Kofleriaceae bacterium]|nr:LamG domain-containing protein [Kofleriaceae bacterium]